MGEKVAETTFVVRFFEEFYEKVCHFKSQVLKGNLVVPEGAEVSNPTVSAETILDQLKNLLHKQSLEAPRHGGEYAVAYYRETQYVMAALADEIFLHMTWEGRKYWEDHLLESQIFESHNAGDIFFQRLENFLRERDPMRADVGYVYLMALGLGFRGKYHGVDDQGRITSYKEQLYRFIYHAEPELFEGDGKICKKAYENVQEKIEGKQFHDFRPWFLIFGGILLGLLFYSFSIWHDLSGPLYKELDKTFTSHEQLTRRSL